MPDETTTAFEETPEQMQQHINTLLALVAAKNAEIVILKDRIEALEGSQRARDLSAAESNLGRAYQHALDVITNLRKEIERLADVEGYGPSSDP